MPKLRSGETTIPPMIITGAQLGTTKPKIVSNYERSEVNTIDQYQETGCPKNLPIQKSLIDYLRISFPVAEHSCVEELINMLTLWLKPFHLAPTKEKPKINKLNDGFQLRSTDVTREVSGSIKWAENRVQLELTGAGCCYINSDKLGSFKMYQLALSYQASIRLIHIAADDLTGKYNQRFVTKALSAGYYTIKGAGPDVKTLISDTAKTRYIGKVDSGKQMCIYEKGKEQKLPPSDPLYSLWTRHELRISARKRFIPLDILITPDNYFVGAYPINKRLIKNVEPRSIKREITKRHTANACKSVKHIKKQFGKRIGTLRKAVPNSRALLDALSRPGNPGDYKIAAYLNEDEVNQANWRDVSNMISAMNDQGYL